MKTSIFKYGDGLSFDSSETGERVIRFYTEDILLKSGFANGELLDDYCRVEMDPPSGLELCSASDLLFACVWKFIVPALGSGVELVIDDSPNPIRALALGNASDFFDVPVSAIRLLAHEIHDRDSGNLEIGQHENSTPASTVLSISTPPTFTKELS